MTGATRAPETTFWHSPGFDGLELERVSGAAQPLAPQLLGDYCLSLCTQGPATSRYRGRDARPKRRDLSELRCGRNPRRCAPQGRALEPPDGAPQP